MTRSTESPETCSECHKTLAQCLCHAVESKYREDEVSFSSAQDEEDRDATAPLFR